LEKWVVLVCLEWFLRGDYLKQNELKPTKWNEDLLAQENIHRGDYIQALKQADNGDYELLIKLQGNLVGG
jgi:hypothetical protein